MMLMRDASLIDAASLSSPNYLTASSVTSCIKFDQKPPMSAYSRHLSMCVSHWKTRQKPTFCESAFDAPELRGRTTCNLRHCMASCYRHAATT